MFTLNRSYYCHPASMVLCKPESGNLVSGKEDVVLEEISPGENQAIPLPPLKSQPEVPTPVVHIIFVSCSHIVTSHNLVSV